MRIKNTENRYGMVTILLHWVMAILIIALLAEGLYMTDLPVSALKLKLYGWHKEYSMLVLMLVIFRVIWRIGNIVPLLPASIPDWQKKIAHLVHWAFYFFMFALPITGWFLTSAAGLPVSFFGLFVMPNLIAPNEKLLALFEEIHTWLGYGLMVVIGLHIAAALKHHFINKDDILKIIIS